MTMQARGAVDAPLSAHIAREIGAAPGQCWANAYAATYYYRPLIKKHAKYVEGWIVLQPDGSMPIEHAWIELSDGLIVEPTLCLLSWWRPTSSAYFAGRKFTRRALKKPTKSGCDLPLTHTYNNKAYRQAYLDAWRHQGAPLEFIERLDGWLVLDLSNFASKPRKDGA